jgi:hypothetical protein
MRDLRTCLIALCSLGTAVAACTKLSGVDDLSFVDKPALSAEQGSARHWTVTVEAEATASRGTSGP